ncbi:MAG: putative cytosolic protein, partial [Pedosphaera sp.]|nr:putative cytosolic protein [Pedosphaera sp.]
MGAKRKTSVPVNRSYAKKVQADPSGATGTVAGGLILSLRTAGLFTVGDQVAPCAILWTDLERQWESVLSDLRALIPELFVLGNYNPQERTGPAIWLRCVEARVIEPSLPQGQIPVLYLPGISKQQLRAVEEFPAELHPLAELQFRGTVWAHPNGRDWTPFEFLSSPHGGLELDVAKDAATAEALLRAMSALLKEPIGDLRGQRLDSEFFNALLAPDLPNQILRWMNAPAQTKAKKAANEWKAFCDECVANYQFHPDKDGELRAAQLLGRREREWAKVWKRFTEAAQRYPGVAELLERAAPSGGGMLAFDRDAWPTLNAEAELDLAAALKELKQRRPDEAAARIQELEREHRDRRTWVWYELGRSQFARALEHLSLLATLVETPLAAASVDELGELYARTGWEADAAALAALDCCTAAEHEQPVCSAVRALYLHWLDDSARNLQNLKKAQPSSMQSRLGSVEAADGRVILFADGLRFDVGRKLSAKLKESGFQVDSTWNWAPVPSVTATAKPYVSPVAHLLNGGSADNEFAVTISETGQRLTHERFQALLAANGVQVLVTHAKGEPGKGAWAEAGSLDKRGHGEGWKLAKHITQEVQDLAGRIRGLLSAGWREVVVVTDHGWLLMPEGFPKVELPKFLAEHRWGRCAAMKETAATNLPVVPWTWNPAVNIASPPGVGCFKAGTEYVHGGISLQELVVPRLVVKAASGSAGQPKISEVKWVGMRCRVTIEATLPGLKADVRSRPADAG